LVFTVGGYVLLVLVTGNGLNMIILDNFDDFLNQINFDCCFEGRAVLVPALTSQDKV
jgi:hypothetical protein